MLEREQGDENKDENKDEETFSARKKPVSSTFELFLLINKKKPDFFLFRMTPIRVYIDP